MVNCQVVMYMESIDQMQLKIEPQKRGDPRRVQYQTYLNDLLETEDLIFQPSGRSLRQRIEDDDSEE
jgi:hypothetical protein